MPGALDFVCTAPNKAVEPTANSVHCAPAVGGGSPPAFGFYRKKKVGIKLT